MRQSMRQTDSTSIMSSPIELRVENDGSVYANTTRTPFVRLCSVVNMPDLSSDFRLGTGSSDVGLKDFESRWQSGGLMKSEYIC